MQQQTEDRYYSRWQDVLNQMNQENQFAESVRQYNQNYAENVRQYNQSYALQQKQFEQEVKQFEKSYDLQIKQFNEDIRQFTKQMEYYREKDAQAYALEIKQLEHQRAELQQRKQEAANDYAIKKQQLAQSQAQWEKEFAASQKQNTYTNNYTDTTGNDNKTNTSSTSGVGQKDYNKTVANIRAMTNGIYNPMKKREAVEDYLARTNFSDKQIESALKQLGYK
jgi:hypothetical protein